MNASIEKLYAENARLKAQLKEKNESGREKQLRLEHIVTNISSRFVHVEKEQLDAEIEHALHEIGLLAGIDRAYIFHYHDEKDEMSNTYEWCAEGISKEIDNLQNLPNSLFPWWNKKIADNEIINLYTLDDLPRNAIEERKTLEAQSVLSLLVVPIMCSGKAAGFMGFDAVQSQKRWGEAEVRMLRLLAEIFGNAFKKITLSEHVRRHHEELEKIVEKRTNEIKEAVRKQQESDEIRQALLNTVPDLFFHLDKYGTYLNVFTSNEKKLYAPKNQFIGRTINETLPTEIARQSMKMLAKAFRSKKVVKYEYQLPINEFFHFFENRIIAISKNEALSIIRDITKQKKSEKYSLLKRDLGFELATTTSREEALKLMLKYVLEAEEIHLAAIYLINPANGNLELIIDSGLSPDFKEKVKKYTPNSREFNMVQKGVAFFEKQYNLPKKYHKIYQLKNLQQIGIIPFKYGNDVIGSIHVGSRSSEKLSENLKTFLELIASQVGGALSRINTQQDLLLSQEHFRQMFETIDDFVFILDTDSRIIKTNPVVVTRLGYSEKELLGMVVLNLHPPNRREEAASIVQEMLAGKRKVCPVPLYTKTGEEIPVETRVVHGEWDGKNALYGISRDITERIRAEEELLNSEARWQIALESSGDGLWDWDIKANQVFFSNQWKKMLGFEENEISDKLEEWKNRIHPDDRNNVKKDLAAHFSGEAALYINEHRVLCKNGNYKWILDRGKVISRDSKKNPIRMIGTHTDISSRKILEDSMVKALQKEKELNELKSHFVSMASHEFRTPLASMLMAVDTLKAYWKKMSIQEIQYKIEKIKNNVQFLSNIVEKTLNLSRLECGKIKFEPVQTDINEFIGNITKKQKKSSGHTHIIKYKQPGYPLNLKIDKQMMELVLTNLLGNSLKYSKPGTNIEVCLREKDDTVNIQIGDEGIGIPEDKIDHIFDAFVRGTNVGNVHGTGLGLTLSKKFIQLHGGDISLKSIINEGTTFFISLPQNPFNNQ